MQNTKFMETAIALAKKGKAVWPNPMVGCVIVKEGKIIARGYHQIFGGLHAEAVALKAAGPEAKNADLYVNLEPCSKHGKQPPCVEAIIKAGIKNVYCAQSDYTQKNSLKKLRAAGIGVYCGLLAKEARALNKDFFAHIKTKPHTAVKFAMSLDGKIAAKTGDSKWITSAASRSWAHKLRADFEAILVGTNTVLKDNPRLTAHGKGRNPVRVIIDEHLQTPPSYNVLDGKTPTVVVCGKQPSFKKEGIIFLPLDFKAFKNDFNILLRALHKIGLKKILIEGGGETIASALSAKAAQEICCFIAPIIIGGKTAPTPVGGQGIDKIKSALKIKNMRVQKIGRDILIRGNL